MKGPATNFFHASWGKTCSWARRLTRHTHYQHPLPTATGGAGEGARTQFVCQQCSRGGGSQARGAPAHQHRRRGNNIRCARPVMKRVRQQARGMERETPCVLKPRAPAALSRSLARSLAHTHTHTLAHALALALALALSLSHPMGAECADGRSAQLEQSLGQGGSARGLRVWGLGQGCVSAHAHALQLYASVSACISISLYISMSTCLSPGNQGSGCWVFKCLYTRAQGGEEEPPFRFLSMCHRIG